MEFTYAAYRNLLRHIKNCGYTFTDYNQYEKVKGPLCILRHDIDQSIEKAYQFSLIEKEENVPSTYFVLYQAISIILPQERIENFFEK